MSFLNKIFGGKSPSNEPPKSNSAPAKTENALPGSIVSPTGKPATLRIQVDRKCCTAMGECLRVAPGVFEIDEDGIAVVVDAAAADRDRLILAAEECPTQAIRLYELDGKRIYPDWMENV